MIKETPKPKEVNPLIAIWVGLVPEVATEDTPNRIYRAADMATHAKLILEAVKDGYKYISLGLDIEENPDIPREDIYEKGGAILALGANAGLKLVGQRPA